MIKVWTVRRYLTWDAEAQSWNEHETIQQYLQVLAENGPPADAKKVATLLLRLKPGIEIKINGVRTLMKDFAGFASPLEASAFEEELQSLGVDAVAVSRCCVCNCDVKMAYVDVVAKTEIGRLIPLCHRCGHAFVDEKTKTVSAMEAYEHDRCVNHMRKDPAKIFERLRRRSTNSPKRGDEVEPRGKFRFRKCYGCGRKNVHVNRRTSIFVKKANGLGDFEECCDKCQKSLREEQPLLQEHECGECPCVIKESSKVVWVEGDTPVPLCRVCADVPDEPSK